jgi:tetratricopeptide (TPR) repeat protein
LSKAMKKGQIFCVILLSCAVFMSLKVTIDGLPRKKIPGSSIIYIPSGKYMKFASLGYSALLADIVYLWAIQYYSNYDIADRFDHMEHIFSIIAELDPHYLDPYEVGAVIAAYEANDLDLAFKLLDMGLDRNPDQWLFPFTAAHLAQMRGKDFEVAREYYKKAMAIEGAPDQTERLYANAAFMTMDYEAAWQSWLEIYQTAEDERVKKIASNHLYQVKAAVDTEAIAEALVEHRNRFGRFPPDLNTLVQKGFLARLPQDLDGKDYDFDPQTGEVKAPTILWKR